MVKGIINAFDHMEFCLVLNLTMEIMVSWLLHGHKFLLLGMLILLLLLIPGSKYLLHTERRYFLIPKMLIY